ncbi:hypothetical protein ACFV42_23735 [Streptomyces solisilvae]|uniref:hypothetical protein n=1 Tax=Streptomyces malaysiensis TaxID=92644 RepID=UPI0036B1C502
MTTSQSTTAPLTGGASMIDAPAIHVERLSTAQREGRSCPWCSDWADPRFPIPIHRTGAVLTACATCAGVFGVPLAYPVSKAHAQPPGPAVR